MSFVNIFNALEQFPAFLYFSFTILGLLVGSFLNVVIYRLPVMMQRDWKSQCCDLLEIEDQTQQGSESFNLVLPNSRCPKCDHAIKPWENIPVISYLFLRGKCSSCSTPISIRYPIIEAVTGALSLVIALQFGISWLSLSLLVLTWCLIALTMIDVDTQLLPDSITLPLMWLGLIVNFFGGLTSFEDAFWGAIAGYMSLWSVFWCFKLITGKEGMGFGDFKLLAALGAWMGWQALPTIIIMSSLVGAVIGVGMILIQGRDKNTPIPFGPYLAIAGWITLLWGDQIASSYLQFAGLK